MDCFFHKIRTSSKAVKLVPKDNEHVSYIKLTRKVQLKSICFSKIANNNWYTKTLHNPEGFCYVNWLEQHVERVGAESGTSIALHVDANFFLPEPLAYSRHVVLVKEGESVGL